MGNPNLGPAVVLLVFGITACCLLAYRPTAATTASRGSSSSKSTLAEVRKLTVLGDALQESLAAGRAAVPGLPGRGQSVPSATEEFSGWTP